MHDCGSTPIAGAAPRRSRIRRRATVIALVAATLAATAACNGTDSGAGADAPKPGGTLYAYMRGDFTNLDPQSSYTVTDINAGRLIYRTLTTYRAEPGAAGSEIAPDLATDLGRPSDGGKLWEFTLKSGLKWEDGSPVTCDNLKYGVQRRFSDLIRGGPPYPLLYLAQNKTPYKGPYFGTDNNGKGLESVECVDQSTIRYHLKTVVSDFGYVVALPVFAPVPKEKDTKDQYKAHPVSNGPYKIAQPSDGKTMVLQRNPNWDRATDPVRKAYPDRIVFKINPEVAESTDELIKSQTEEFSNGISLDGDVPPQFVQQVVNDPDLSRRAVSGTFAATRYLAINMRRVKDERCRKALIYAFNKRKFRTALGGSIFGDFATTMIPPALKSHKEFDLFNSNAAIEGDLDKAKRMMDEAAAAGTPCATKLRLAHYDTKIVRRQMAVVVESYQQIGIQIELVPIPTGDFYGNGPTSVTIPGNPYDLISAAWSPDWSNGSSVIQPLFDSRLIPKDSDPGNLNFSELVDKDIDTKIDEAMAEENLDRQAKLWGELDEKIQAKAPMITIVYPKALRMAGTKVRGQYLQGGWGQPDLISMGVVP